MKSSTHWFDSWDAAVQYIGVGTLSGSPGSQ